MTMLATPPPGVLQTPTLLPTPPADPPRVTVDQFLARLDADGFELVDGQFVESEPMNAIAALVSMEITARLRDHVRGRDLGWVFNSDVGLRIFDNANFRKADGCFVAKARLPAGVPDGPLTVAPELVVEVVSPTDVLYKVREKVQLYLDAGVRLVWLVEPPTRSITVYAGSMATPIVLTADAGATLDGGAVLPGFSCPVLELFPRQPAKTVA